MILRHSSLEGLLSTLSTGARVYVPAKADGVTKFVLYSSSVRPDFSITNTTMPPKDLLFPQTQHMYRYGTDAEGVPYVEPVHDADDVIVFGMRPCDVRSIECMDDVFLTKGFVDVSYQAKRERLLMVAMACTAPAPTCFCNSMGLCPTAAPLADILLRPAGATDASGDTAYLVEAQSEKGQAALAQWESYKATDTSDADFEPVSAAVSCSLKVSMVGVKDKLEAMFDHPIWEQLSKKCITCGTCTFVCPTCHCFDISQENRLSEGTRFRCWDSCMFTAYTEMAGGHNPRASKSARVRQRFMHKLCFFEQRYGKTLCVGCGRCVEKCPVALDITCLIDQIGAADVAY